jgi:putative membrane protein insertion efficiency factor
MTIRRPIFRNLVVAGLSAPIHFYRRFLSALLPPACRFQPSCSVYALEAIHTHGPLHGLILAIKRLARCHPIKWLGGASGFDPVPPSRYRQP